MVRPIAEWYSPVVPGTNLLHPRPGPPLSLIQYFPEIDTSLWPSSLWYPSRQGETVEEVHSRAEGFLSLFPQALDKKHPTIDRTRVLMVSHAATVIALARGLVGDREIPLKVGCCTVTELNLKPDQAEEGREKGLLGAYHPVKLADGAHLKGGALREWGFDDVEVEKGRVVEDPGEPGTETEEDFPVGPQIHLISNL
ncbi:hypothetical protein H1R20_g5961, partial [Candolleomyces eurysporus]